MTHSTPPAPSRCTCQAAGWCPIFRKHQSPRMVAICAGELFDAAKTAQIRLNWWRQFGDPVRTALETKG